MHMAMNASPSLVQCAPNHSSYTTNTDAYSVHCQGTTKPPTECWTEHKTANVLHLGGQCVKAWLQLQPRHMPAVLADYKSLMGVLKAQVISAVLPIFSAKQAQQHKVPHITYASSELLLHADAALEHLIPKPAQAGAGSA